MIILNWIKNLIWFWFYDGRNRLSSWIFHVCFGYISYLSLYCIIKCHGGGGEVIFVCMVFMTIIGIPLIFLLFILEHIFKSFRLPKIVPHGLFGISIYIPISILSMLFFIMLLTSIIVELFRDIFNLY